MQTLELAEDLAVVSTRLPERHGLDASQFGLPLPTEDEVGLEHGLAVDLLHCVVVVLSFVPQEAEAVSAVVLPLGWRLLLLMHSGVGKGVGLLLLLLLLLLRVRGRCG